MKITSKQILLGIVLFALSSVAAAQSKRTEHTYKLDDPDARPPATIEDVAWLAGSYEGEAFGMQFEEVWNPPSAGSMVGFFKLFKGDQVAMYEIVLLVEEEGSLVLKVKHFNADFTAWEEKEDYVKFRFIKAEEDAVHFSGISFYKTGENELTGYLVMKYDDGIREEKLVYRRN